MTITNTFKGWSIKCESCQTELTITDDIDGSLKDSDIQYCPCCGMELERERKVA